MIRTRRKSAEDSLDISSLTPEAIPDDWYTRIFDGRYLEVDQRRNLPSKTLAEVAWLEDVGELSRPSRILDLGCGYGRHAIELAKRGHEVVGLDLSSVLLNKAESDARKARVRVDWRQQDMRDVPQEGFDLVVSMHTSLGYFPTNENNREVINAVRGALNSEGRFVFDQIDPRKPEVQQRQRLERTEFSDGTRFRKLSKFRVREMLWYGLYSYDDGPRAMTWPFRIRIQTDGLGRVTGVYAFASGQESRTPHVRGEPQCIGA